MNLLSLFRKTDRANNHAPRAANIDPDVGKDFHPDFALYLATIARRATSKEDLPPITREEKERLIENLRAALRWSSERREQRERSLKGPELKIHPSLLP